MIISYVDISWPEKAILLALMALTLLLLCSGGKIRRKLGVGRQRSLANACMAATCGVMFAIAWRHHFHTFTASAAVLALYPLRLEWKKRRRLRPR